MPDSAFGLRITIRLLAGLLPAVALAARLRLRGVGDGRREGLAGDVWLVLPRGVRLQFAGTAAGAAA